MNRQDWENIFFLLKDYAKRYKKIVVCLVFISIITAVRPYIAVVLTGYLLDAVYSGRDAAVLLRYALMGVGCSCAAGILESVLLETFNTKQEYMMEIQNLAMNRKSMSMDYEYLEDVHVHDMRQRIEKCCGSYGLTAVLNEALRDWLSAGISMLVAVCIVLPMFVHKNMTKGGVIGSWYMSVLFFIVLGVFIWLNFKAGVFFNEKVRKYGKKFSPFENRKKFYMDILAGCEEQKDLRIYAEQPVFEKEAERIAKGVKQIQDGITRCQIHHGTVGQALSAATGLMVYIFAGLQAYAGLITIGSVVTYAASILKFTTSIAKFTELSSDLKADAAYAGDYREYMELEKQKHEGTIPVEKRRDDRFSVEFDHVSFKYPGSDQYVIRDLNVSFVIGEKMAIVGKNGSGKTTFIKLLCRLYDVTEGCIKVNGIDIRKYDYKEYCSLFSVVFQDFKMFAFPLGENIASTGHVDEERVRDTLIRAGLKERLKMLPDGFETYVGKEFDETGVSFSGGEKQKMAIARAIYKDAPFVIMDEPTAALDPEAECEVYAGFDRMVGKKTAIYISHRLASCRFCEDILVFDRGKVIQRGSHEELEKQDGLYQELWSAQAQYYA